MDRVTWIRVGLGAGLLSLGALGIWYFERGRRSRPLAAFPRPRRPAPAALSCGCGGAP